ncbi:MAG: cytidylate kinase-like family protein [Vicinamibacterales bacterium]
MAAPASARRWRSVWASSTRIASILAEAARALHVETSDLEPLEERTASIWEQIGTLFALGAPDTPYIPPTLPSVNESQLFEIERQVIKRIAQQGNAVIVGRGAAHILGDTADVLRVFLHAPRERRIQLAMAEYGLADEAAAEQLLRDSDATRAKFVKTLTNKNWCDATLYDITLDTGVVGLERTVEVLASLVQRPPAAALPPLAPRAADDRTAR